MHEMFHRIAVKTAWAAGSPWVFMLSLVIIVVWACTGPIFGFSDTWQLIINTGTTIVTFLMVFLIQNTQNRDAKAIQLKLDELIRAGVGARNNLMNLEDLSEKELDSLEEEFRRLRKRDSSEPALRG